MNICDTNLFGNGLLYVTFNQDHGKQKQNILVNIFFFCHESRSWVVNNMFAS